MVDSPAIQEIEDATMANISAIERLEGQVYFLLCLLNSWTNITLFTLVLLIELETLSEIQLVLLYTQIDGVHLLLHGGDGLLHG
jgi:hypothetical protein